MKIEEKLFELEALMAKASLLPWANTDTVKELFNVEPDDWWKIYPTRRKTPVFRPGI